ncbi:MAG: DUF2085 domain-containing protein [Chloroflexota bacterium]|jgi:uncharacterized membrane protein|nr:DUF2085 domain-containing protein [Chloroflexota bacterium]
MTHFTPHQRWLIIGTSLVICLALVLPTNVIQIFDLVGYAVCHRIPERSFIIGGNQLPMCARDTGMFGVALLGVLGVALTQTQRFAQFPKTRYLILLALGALTWAIDGFNSYLLLATGRILWYMPQNWLRLVTGAFMGAALSTLVVPLFNASVWQPSLRSNTSHLRSWRDLFFVWGIALTWVLLVLWQQPVLYGLYTSFSALGTLMLLTVVNGLTVLLLMGREAQVTAWSQMTKPLLIGFALTLIEIALIVALRTWLTQQLGLPF